MFTCVSRSKVSSLLLFKSRRWTADRSDPRGVPELCGRRPGFPLRAPAGVSPDIAALSLPVLPDTPPVLTGVTGAFLLQGSGARLGAMGGGCGAGATGSSPVLLCRFTSTRPQTVLWRSISVLRCSRTPGRVCSLLQSQTDTRHPD